MSSPGRARPARSTSRRCISRSAKGASRWTPSPCCPKADEHQARRPAGRTAGAAAPGEADAARVAAAEGDDRAGADRNGDRDPLVRPGWAGGSGGWAYQLWRRALFHDDHDHDGRLWRSEEHKSELQTLMSISYA